MSVLEQHAVMSVGTGYMEQLVAAAWLHVCVCMYVHVYVYVFVCVCVCVCVLGERVRLEGVTGTN